LIADAENKLFDMVQDEDNVQEEEIKSTPKKTGGMKLG
jgi:hypothetical protein